jgi:hypothetical protein
MSLRVYKGAPPTSVDTVRTADLLASFGGGTWNLESRWTIANGVAVHNKSVLPTCVVTQSGAPSWFRIETNESTNPASAVHHLLTGTVGGPGSGADLIFPDTEFVVGQNRSIGKLQVAL